MRAHLLATLAAISAGAFCLTDQQAREPDFWPNAKSSANSDEWLVRNHDRIRVMRPKLLVINFVNGLKPFEARAKVDNLINALRESSRYHGYENRHAPAFLEYEVFKLVDLTDPSPLPADKRLEGNSSFYPRQVDTGESNFRYDALYSQEFAKHYDIRDESGNVMNLKQLVDSGTINEVWFLGNHGEYGAPFESIERKQVYDANFQKIPGKNVHAGNGGTDRQPWIGRSLRILFINAGRGPGCAMESLGHSFEWMATEGPVPYFQRYFMEFADFDLDKRYGMPFSKLYAREGTDLDYPAKDVLAYKWKGEEFKVQNYQPRGGSVHFTPNGRKDYDLTNTQPVLSTVENYRRFNGPDGKDRAEMWSNEKFAPYKQLANDCMGQWIVYWRQSMPGLDNLSKDDAGKPMKNWWPFLFY
jgi:hypothetical protein